MNTIFNNSNVKQSTIEEILQGSLNEFCSKSVVNYIISIIPESRSTRTRLLYCLIGDLPIDSNQERVLFHTISVIELLHRASIIVDDVVDGDEERRSAPTFHKAHGVEYASLYSHILTSQAMKIANRLPGCLSTRIYDAYGAMAVAQSYDVGAIRINEPGWESYVARIVPKTDALFEVVFDAAALIRRLDLDRASSIGRRVGLLYQISNDLSDATPAQLKLRSRKRERADIDALWAAEIEVAGRLFVNSKGSISSASLEQQKLQYLEHLSARTMNEICDEVQTLCSDWHQTVVDFCSWVRTSECWDHSITYKESH